MEFGEMQSQAGRVHALVAAEAHIWAWARGETFYRRRHEISYDDRIAVALKRNCAVLQYQSRSWLNFFRGLLPWRHDVPSVAQAEAIYTIETSRGTSPDLEEMDRIGRNFLRDFSPRDARAAYFRNLLSEYVSIFR